MFVTVDGAPALLVRLALGSALLIAAGLGLAHLA